MRAMARPAQVVSGPEYFNVEVIAVPHPDEESAKEGNRHHFCDVMGTERKENEKEIERETREEKKNVKEQEVNEDQFLEQAICRASAEAADRAARAAKAFIMVQQLQGHRQAPCPAGHGPLQAMELAEQEASCVICHQSSHELLALAVCLGCETAICARCIALYNGASSWPAGKGA